MQSLASLMSVNTTGDIAPLEDFEEEDCKLYEASFSPIHSYLMFYFHVVKVSNPTQNYWTLLHKSVNFLWKLKKAIRR